MVVGSLKFPATSAGWMVSDLDMLMAAAGFTFKSPDWQAARRIRIGRRIFIVQK